MSEFELRWIEDDIAGSWVEDWAAAVLVEIEEFLAKHADFERYLAAREATQPSAE